MSPIQNQTPDQWDSARYIHSLISNIISLWRNDRLIQFPEESKDEQNPFIETFKTTQWDMLRQDSDLQRAFDSYILIHRNGLRSPRHEIYPAATEFDVQGYSAPHELPLLVDVGGSTGYGSTSFRAAKPHINGRVIVQDPRQALRGRYTTASPLNQSKVCQRNMRSNIPVLVH